MRIAGAERAVTGRNAQSLKYDILTALGAHACAADKHVQRLALRLITLIVARYNWATDEIAVGQREMASLWSLDERSVKRDIARLRDMGWLVVRRPAARGRVATHGLGLDAILRQTRDAWSHVGSDFVARMTGTTQPEVSPSDNIVPFPVPATDAGPWAQMQAQLFRQDPHLYTAWFAALHPLPVADGVMTLIAPSRFHASYILSNHAIRLARLAVSVDPGIQRLDIRAGG